MKKKNHPKTFSCNPGGARLCLAVRGEGQSITALFPKCQCLGVMAVFESSVTWQNFAQALRTNNFRC